MRVLELKSRSMGKLKEGLIRLSCHDAVKNKLEFNRLSDFFCPVGNDFYSLFNTIHDFLFILNAGNKVIFFNQPLIQQLGYSESELQAKNILELYPPDGHNEVKLALENLKQGNSSVYAVPMLRKNATEIQVETELIEGVWGNSKAIIGISRDISERRNYEQQLKHSNQRLEMVLHASDAGWWDWKVKEDELTLNEKWCAMRGYERGEIPPHVESWKKLVHPDDFALANKNLEKHFRNELPFYQAEYRAKTKSGGYIWILDTGKVTEFDEKGNPLRVVGINIDISYHKLNELKLQKNLRQQELLSEIALDLNSIENFDDKINAILKKVGLHTEVSRVYIFEDINDGLSTCNTYEWCNNGIVPQKEELSDVPYEIIPSWKEILFEQGRLYSENISELPDDLRAILEPQEIKSIVIYPLNVNNKFFGFIGFDECIRYKHWTKTELELLRTFSGIIANAYERLISEKSLRESEAKNTAILASIPDILFHFNKEGKILSYRSSSLEELAFHPDKFLNKRVYEIFPEEFSVKVKEAIDVCLKDGSCKFDYVLPVNNEFNDYEARMSKMNDTEVIAIVRNVSERKQYERQLTEERDKANQANKAKSEFLANMSHEIRTPMNAILGFSEALYHKLESPHHRKMVKSILSSGNLLLSLLNDILDLSKIEAGMLDISHQSVDLINIIKEIKLLFLSKAEKKNIEINLHYPENFPSLLMLDEIRIKQVIFNLVGNAIKFTHAGQVNIKLAFRCDVEPCGQLRIDVEDTGIGIPESQQEIIFETFRQQSGQSNRLYEGAGLGLTISKRLVEKMFGNISVKSDVEKGSVFTVLLPSSYVESNEVVSDNTTTEDLNIVFDPAQILVVDDVSSNVEAVESLLENSGIAVATAENGEIALEVLKHTPISLVLLDIRMPVMNGYQFAKKMKEDPAYRNIPVIAYTASVFSTDHERDSSNFDGYLFKPVNKISLFKELKKYLSYKSTNKTVSQSSQEVTLESLPEDVVQKLPEIYDWILLNLFPKWESIKDQLILFKIEEFASEIKQQADYYKFDYLSRYADKLQDELDMVDLESLKESLSEFPDIVDKIGLKIKN